MYQNPADYSRTEGLYDGSSIFREQHFFNVSKERIVLSDGRKKIL
jgi:hypothetical protein